ncbi:uncharacterized protein LOC109603150 isoform X3 [Aethina tumida]|uniref:uncharacterized protein LOC109603150 isoform X3 n=1 Tax=Aethina tumida TaxID=116153 RepID=UPI00214969A4|nr:uncharacterized protein LOC109603150 isoform X3 [Aethina tumida]
MNGEGEPPDIPIEYEPVDEGWSACDEYYDAEQDDAYYDDYYYEDGDVIEYQRPFPDVRDDYRAPVAHPYANMTRPRTSPDAELVQYETDLAVNPLSKSQHNISQAYGFRRTGNYYRMVTENYCGPELRIARPVLDDAKSGGRRCPTTVKIPKFYKRASGSGLYKRPSSSCTPAISQQQDHVVIERPRSAVSRARTPETQVRHKEEVVQEEHHIMDSGGDVTTEEYLSHLDKVLAKYEAESRKGPFCVYENSPLAKLAKTLKPRIPSSIQQRMERQKAKEKMKVLENYEIHTIPKTQLNATGGEIKMTPDSLEELLEKLRHMKPNNRASNDSKTPNETKPNQEPAFQKQYPHTVTQKPPNSLKKCYNYQDISDKLQKSSSYHISTIPLGPQSTEEMELPKTNEESPLLQEEALPQTKQDSFTQYMEENYELDVKASQTSNASCKNITTQTLDDNSALELHRSKSYIVNLIDRALSKELGTVPSSRWNEKQIENFNTKKAIKLINRHKQQPIPQEIEKDDCTDLAPILLDSIISNESVPTESSQLPSTSETTSKTCSCRDQPEYVKQLRQLRWSHLKHIQKEVKQLEELERFLDSCGDL